MVRLIFLTACLLYLGFQSLFVHTSHTTASGRHIFAYNWLAVILGLGFNLIPIGAAVFLWRVKKDKVGAALFLLFIPLFAGLILPQYFMERVEVTSTHLVHRREPPHTRFNADIPSSEIVYAIGLQRDTGIKGYVLKMKDGRIVELPANTVLTAASSTIDTEFRKRNIPFVTRMVRSQQK